MVLLHNDGVVSLSILTVYTPKTRKQTDQLKDCNTSVGWKGYDYNCPNKVAL